MTTANATPQTAYALSGTQTGPFSTVFGYASSDEVQVAIEANGDETILTLGTGYSLAATGGNSLANGGAVTILEGAVPGGGWSPSGTEHRLIVRRVTNGAQGQAFGAMASFDPLAIEQALDKATRQIQDVRPGTNRAFKVPTGETGPTLPKAADRAGMLLAFDASGKPTKGALRSTADFDQDVTDTAANAAAAASSAAAADASADAAAVSASAADASADAALVSQTAAAGSATSAAASALAADASADAAAASAADAENAAVLYPELIRDTIVAALRDGPGIAVAVDDSADTIQISVVTQDTVIQGSDLPVSGIALFDALALKQNLDATLTALSGISTAANKLIYATGSDTFATTDLSAFARTLLAETGAAAARTTLGAGTVTSVGGGGSVSGLTLTGTVTGSGSLTLGGTLAVLPSNFASQTQNTFLAAPNGASGQPTFRTIVAADIPTLNQNTTGSAARLTTSRSIAISGDVVWSVNFDGSANVTAAGTIQPGAITLAKMANLSQNTFIGRVSAGSGAPEALTPTQVKTALAIAQSDVTGLTSDLALKADLVDGVVPANQLPGYVDDILEFANQAAFPVTGDAGKLYVAIDVNKTYRWAGSAYTEVAGGVALGETQLTAYRGDRGKAAYDHSQLTTGNPHGTTKADLGLGSVDNVADANKPVSSLQQAALDLKANLAGPTFTGTVETSGQFLNARSSGRPELILTRTGTIGSDFPRIQFQYSNRYDEIVQTATGLAFNRNTTGTPQTLLFTGTALTIDGVALARTDGAAFTGAVSGTNLTLSAQLISTTALFGAAATDVTLDTNFNAQVKLRPSGWSAGFGADGVGAWVGGNSGARSMALVTNKTRQLIVDGAGNVRLAGAAYQAQGALRVDATGNIIVGVPTEVTVTASPFAVAATTLRLNTDVYSTPEIRLPLLSSVPEGHVIRVTAHGIPESYQKAFVAAHADNGTAIRPSYSPTANVEKHYLIGCGQVIEYTKTGTYWRAAVVAQGQYEEILLRAYKKSENGGSATAAGTGAWALYPDVSGYPDADSRRAWGRKTSAGEVIYYNDTVNFPATGEAGKYYVDRNGTDADTVYTWNGSAYVLSTVPEAILEYQKADYLIPVAGVYHIAAKTDATCATAGTGAANEVHAAISNNFEDVGGPGSVTEKLMSVGDRTTAFVAHHASMGPGTRIVGHFWAGANLTVNEPNSYLEVRLLAAL